MVEEQDPILLKVEDGIAIITLNRPGSLNSLEQKHYRELASKLREVEELPEVYCTILTANGRFFSSGADVRGPRPGPQSSNNSDSEYTTVREITLSRFATGNMDLTKALYNHPKILVAALNGPVVGLSAAILGWMDFIYSVEDAWLLTPFSSLSIVAEGGASLTFPIKMGWARATEALVMGKRLSAKELHAAGFINELYPPQESSAFSTKIVKDIRARFADLDKDSMQITKSLMRSNLPNPDSANAKEIFAAADRFETGKPFEQFARMARKEKRHKL